MIRDLEFHEILEKLIEKFPDIRDNVIDYRPAGFWSIKVELKNSESPHNPFMILVEDCGDGEIKWSGDRNILNYKCPLCSTSLSPVNDERLLTSDDEHVTLRYSDTKYRCNKCGRRLNTIFIDLNRVSCKVTMK